ncbi:MAG: hypothetical protein KME11_02060 [Timaviella obliquedivisa GSE-PSE-MK23-08B]|jgi:hypothetical protein|nr:hypothetical protein [Timaviella obliquedivisa GSE-PSE-MK23-08B]
MPQPSPSQSVLKGANPFLEDDIPDSEDIYEPTPFGIAALTNVDHLMNEIFQDMEQTLERGTALPADLHQEPEPAIAPFMTPVTPLDVPLLSPGLPSSPLLESVAPYRLPEDDLLSDPDLEELLVIDQEVAKPRQSSGGFLLSAVLATLILTGGLFATVKFRLYQMIPGFSGSEVVEGRVPPITVPEAAQTGKDQQFLEYVGRSLNRIDRTATRNSGTSGAIATGIATLPPPPSVAPSPLVVERYVPVYQPPLFGSFTSPPGTTTSNTNAMTRTAVAAAPAIVVPPAPTVRPPVVRAAVPAPVVPSPSPIAAIVPSIDLSETHALIGLLELGDRSAALLEVNGVPQRIQVGEKIGASGWKIMSISNQTAIIQRNSEVRSIHVGQKF